MIRKIKKFLEDINPDNSARVTPDFSNTKNVKPKSIVDKAIAYAENIDGTISNIGASGNLASFTKLPGIASAGGLLTGIASKFEPVQAALWSIDAARSLTDEEYRKAHQQSIENLGIKGNGVMGGRLDSKYFNTTAALQTLGHPVGTSGALIRAAQEARSKIAQAKLDEAALQEKIDFMRRKREAEARKREIPKVTPNTIQQQQWTQAANQAFR